MPEGVEHPFSRAREPFSLAAADPRSLEFLDGLYAELLPEVGFLIATAFASAYLTWRLGTKPLQSVVVGVLTSVGIYVIFHLVLGLSLARGPLGF